MAGAAKQVAKPKDFSYLDYRCAEALKAGLTEVQAIQFANGGETLHLLWHLWHDLGATPEQIALLVI
jgi:hypothetical protein